MIIATISVTSGVDKGFVFFPSSTWYWLGLILFILFMGDTGFLLNALVLNVGDYVNRFMGMTLNSLPSDRPVEWMITGRYSSLAWVAWSPFVGLFWRVFARAHHSPVCGRYTDYSVHLHPAVAVGIRQ